MHAGKVIRAQSSLVQRLRDSATHAVIRESIKNNLMASAVISRRYEVSHVQGHVFLTHIFSTSLLVP